MDFNATVDLIIRELNEAVEIIEDLRNYQGVPSLQVELAKSKCKNAAEVIRLLKIINETEVPPVKPEKVVKNDMQNPIINKPESFISRPEPPINRPEPAISRPEPAIDKPELTEIKGETLFRESADKKTVTPGSTKKPSDSVTLGDTFGKRTNSINEKLGIRKDDDDLRELIKSKPITSLAGAIGINDKFLFIRELFHGDTELYNRTITTIDSSSGFSDAKAIIMNYADNDEENEAVRQLLDLVKRKFPGNE